MLAQNQADVKTVVRFDRSARKWQAINGHVIDFPAGPHGHRQAMLAALAHDRPELSAVVGDIASMHDHAPAIVDRLLKAAQLVARGHVFSDGKVRSQTTEDVYHVSLDGYYCTCEDFEAGQQRHAGLSQFGGVYTDYAEWPICKHLLAALLAEFANVELHDEPIPFEPSPSAKALPAQATGSIEDWLG